MSAMVTVSRLVGRMAGMRPYLASASAAPREPVPGRPRVVVVGGGIAGACAAVVLVERGVPVVVCEAAGQLGGRLGAHPHTLPDGTVQWVDHAGTGIGAANIILAAHGHRTEPVWSVPPKGILARQWAAAMRRQSAQQAGAR